MMEDISNDRSRKYLCRTEEEREEAIELLTNDPSCRLIYVREMIPNNAKPHWVVRAKKKLILN